MKYRWILLIVGDGDGGYVEYGKRPYSIVFYSRDAAEAAAEWYYNQRCETQIIEEVMP